MASKAGIAPGSSMVRSSRCPLRKPNSTRGASATVRSGRPAARMAAAGLSSAETATGEVWARVTSSGKILGCR
ncbi:hypothetical protein Sgou_05750 [Streptomyces gougerotii]|uniref:Uncharacterized protein n=1 Tax=Streptomyces gougerotii TaxID=53448 RepID=A0A8H9HAG5_9ACTN|nr:hypothetical protein Sgou_05750 [Streptomyces gougerotii]GGU51552.1 hypothetical protein GCM10010227_00020 [Streptomyces gougerotii]